MKNRISRVAFSWLLGMVPLLAVGCGDATTGGSSSASAAPVARKGVTSAQELAKVIDLSTLPAPKDATFGTRTAAELEAYVPLAVKPATEFYLKALAEKGFKPSTEPNSQQMTAEYSQSALVKDGHALSMSVIPGGDGKVMVSIYRHGDLDARTLPQSKGAEPLYESPTHCIYVGKGTVEEELKLLRENLGKSGWQEYGPPNSAVLDDPEHRQFSFRNQGYLLSGSVGVAPAQDNKTSVQYQVRTLAHELPAPADATKVEYDDDRSILNCEIPGNLDVADAYYLKTMPALGYTAMKHDEPKETSRVLRFETADKGIYLISLRNDDQKATKVEFIYYSPELLAKMREPKAEKPGTDDGETKPATQPVYARSIPFPAVATDIQYDAASERITFKSKSEIEPLVKSLREKLIGAGWTEQKEATSADKNAGSMVLSKGNANLTIVLVNLGLGGDVDLGGLDLGGELGISASGTTATISTSGLNWDEPEAK